MIRFNHFVNRFVIRFNHFVNRRDRSGNRSFAGLVVACSEHTILLFLDLSFVTSFNAFNSGLEHNDSELVRACVRALQSANMRAVAPTRKTLLYDCQHRVRHSFRILRPPIFLIRRVQQAHFETTIYYKRCNALARVPRGIPPWKYGRHECQSLYHAD